MAGLLCINDRIYMLYFVFIFLALCLVQEGIGLKTEIILCMIKDMGLAENRAFASAQDILYNLSFTI